MAYTRQTWRDGQAGATPITAERLNVMEAGIESAHNLATIKPTPVLILGTSDPVPAGTAAGTLIVRTSGASTPPPSPLSISAAPGVNQVTITASGGSGATAFALYRGTTPTGTPIATSFPFTDTGRPAGTSVSYVATATNAAGTVTSNVASATPTAPAGGNALVTNVSVIGTAHGMRAFSTDGSVTHSLTVPAGVTTSHLGIVMMANASNDYPTFTMPAGWVPRTQNSTAYNNSSVSIFTRLGGHTAGQALQWTVPTDSSAYVFYAIWFDTQGKDIETVGATGGRFGTSSAVTTIPGVTTTKANQIVLVIASERTIASGSAITSWAPSAPVQDWFVEDANGTATSAYFGHFTQAVAGATGDRAATYTTGSGNGGGMMLVLP